MNSLIRLNKLEDIDMSATEVQFKNRATGKYIVLRSDPRGGGALEAGDLPEITAWRFYQHKENPDPYNFEVKREPVDGFNWSDYHLRTEEASFVAWNHAKRLPDATIPDFPHAWSLEQSSAGFFRIKNNNHDSYLEQTKDMVLYIKGSKAPKIITLPFDETNQYQEWEIYANKSHCPHYYIGSNGKNYKEFFIEIDQTEENVKKFIINAIEFENKLHDNLTKLRNPLWQINETGQWVIYHHIDNWPIPVSVEILETFRREFFEATKKWIELLYAYDPSYRKSFELKVFGFVFNKGVTLEDDVEQTYSDYPIVKGWDLDNELSPWLVEYKNGASCDQIWYPIPDFNDLIVKGNAAPKEGVTYSPNDWTHYSHPENVDMFYTKYWQYTLGNASYGQRQYVRLVHPGHMNTNNGESNFPVLIHEIGHSQFMDDFNNEKYPGTMNGINSVMKPGPKTVPTDFDAVILRIIWKYQLEQL